ncbi:hypothetical protein Q4Q34_10630 [Flavivirga abyssicola]|uniref:hypothetical protein n=1 Tax=Flavivirga abyssicola TaxID=3063533 RepID=UPI0026E1013F|nr:hypothetical protein [Flavivirga sp. MEBiC07777]WVK11680.1 hypothetical protein Q4Q34_10630 [Flavivirga sp. MEBiC07777]
MKNVMSLIVVLLATSLQSHCQIDKIEFTTDGYAYSADYAIIIYDNNIAIYNALSDNYKFPHNGETLPLRKDKKGRGLPEPEIKGLFMSELSKKVFKEISNLVLSLEEEFDKKTYLENNLHASVGELKVTFQNENVRSIYDYGMKGTDRLIRLYALLDDLRFSQKWK